MTRTNYTERGVKCMQRNAVLSFETRVSNRWMHPRSLVEQYGHKLFRWKRRCYTTVMFGDRS